MTTAQSSDVHNHVIPGKVVEYLSGESVPGANVVIRSRGKMGGFAVTDENGDFNITLPHDISDPTVSVSAIGYKTYTAPLDTTAIPLIIALEDGALQLQEVVVKSRAITEGGDTVRYNVGSFAQKQDQSIGDVLRRMPGIDVTESGKIKYQGNDINRFYIEGSDLLGGKYGIATNGIDHEDVGAVEVLENHQPIRVLQGFGMPDQAAINLKLKSKAKATLVGHGTVGGGWTSRPEGAEWEADLFGMMIMGKYQNITTLKTNNTGIRIADQLTDYYSARADENITPYLSISLPVPPQLRPKSTFFNRSWLVSTNNLWHAGDGSDLKLQLDYLNDRVSTSASSFTTYILPDGEQIVSEDKSAIRHTNSMNMKLSSEINRKTIYLSDVLNTDLSWNSVSLDVSGSLSNSQHARLPDFHIGNTLKLMKRFHGSRLVTFTSINEWRTLPERLSVIKPEGTYGEKIGQHAFYTDERASFGFAVKKIHVDFEGGVMGFFRKFSADIHDLQLSAESRLSSMTTNYLRLYVSPSMKWEHNRVEAMLRIPVSLYSYFFGDETSNRTECFLSPLLSFSWKPTQGLTLAASGNLSRSPASLHQIHNFPVLTDYRHVDYGTPEYLPSSSQSVTLSLRWRHVPSGVFVNASASRRWNRAGYESVQFLQDDFVFTSFRNSSSSGEMTMIRGDVSTSLPFINGIAGVRANYMVSDSKFISQDVPSSLSARMSYLAPFLNGALGGYVNWMLRFSWSRNSMDVSSLTRRKNDSFIWTASLTLTPLSWLTWQSSLDHYRMQTAGGFVNMPMLDSKLTFQLSKKLYLSAGVGNILDKKDFHYSTYGMATQTESHTPLRGREFILSLNLKK